MVDDQTIARPYAKAAFLFASEQNKIPDWLMMLDYAAQCMQHSVVTKLFNEKPYEQSFKVLLQLGQDQFDDYYVNFLRLLAKNKRLRALPSILETFAMHVAQQKQQQTAVVYCALDLSDEQRRHIQDTLKKKYAQDFILKCEIDSSLISGVRVQVGDEVIDSSIKAKLQRLNQQLHS